MEPSSGSSGLSVPISTLPPSLSLHSSLCLVPGPPGHSLGARRPSRFFLTTIRAASLAHFPGPCGSMKVPGPKKLGPRPGPRPTTHYSFSSATEPPPAPAPSPSVATWAFELLLSLAADLPKEACVTWWAEVAPTPRAEEAPALTGVAPTSPKDTRQPRARGRPSSGPHSIFQDPSGLCITKLPRCLLQTSLVLSPRSPLPFASCVHPGRAGDKGLSASCR